MPAGTRGVLRVLAFHHHRVTWTRALVVGDSRLSVTLKATPRRGRPDGELTLTVTTRDAAGKPTAAAVELAVLDRGIHTLGAQGLSGREPLFGVMSAPSLSRVSAMSFRWPARTVVGSREETDFQQAMGFLLATLPGTEEMTLTVPPPEGATMAVTPPAWLASMASLLRRLPAFGQAPVTHAAPVLGLLLLSLWLWRRRATSRWVSLFVLLQVLALLLLPLLPWSRAPRLEPADAGLQADEELDEKQAHLLRALADPRRFEGLHPLAVDRSTADLAHERFPPMTGPLVEISPGRLVVNGRTVAPLKDFRLDPRFKRDGASGYLITPLLRRMEATTVALKRVSKAEEGRREFRGLATFIVPPRAPYRLLSEVLYTVGQAEVGTYGIIAPQRLRIVNPRAGLGAGALAALALLLLAAGVLVIRGRCRAPSYLALVLLAGYIGLHYLLVTHPFDDRAALRFPLEEGLRALHPWLAGALALTMAWEVAASRRVSSALGAMALVAGLLAVPLGRDHGMYYDASAVTLIKSPHYGAAPGASAAPGAGRGVGVVGPPSAEAVRASLVRRRFPDTLLYDPLVITDGQGRAVRRLRLGHQLTTWKATALASSRGGAMGLARDQVVSAQPLQLELELPPRLTVGDRLHLPVSVYNHQKKAATVTVRLKPAPWFEALKPAGAQLRLTPGGGAMAYLPLRVLTPGDHRLQATAASPGAADAVERPVQVAPAGAVTVVKTAALMQAPTAPGRVTLRPPAAAVEGSARLRVTVYPDLASQLRAGANALLSMPHGCAEQTISSTLPNVLLLEAFPDLSRGRSRLARQARDNATMGYQRLLKLERPGGGLSAWGTGAADAFLSAYALELLVPLKRQLGVGGAMISRLTRVALTSLQSQGTYRQAAVVRSLARAARKTRLPGVRDALTRALVRLVPAARRSADPYLLALVAGAMLDLGHDPPTARALAARLARMGKRRAQRGAHWSNARDTVAGSRGGGADVETTALAAAVLLQAGDRAAARQAMLWLTLNRRAGGGWWASQDSLRVLGLLATLAAQRSGPASAAPVPTINGATPSVARDSGSGLVYRRPGVAGPNTVELPAGGKVTPAVALVRLSCRVPWASVDADTGGQRLNLKMDHDRTEVGLLQTITARFTVSNRGRTVAMPMLRFQVPPGFQVERAALAALARRDVIRRHELEAPDVILYLPPLALGQTLRLEVPLLARAPVEAAAPGARVHDYYDPTNQHVVRSARLKVTRREQGAAPRAASESATVKVLTGAPFALQRSPAHRRWAAPQAAASAPLFIKRWFVHWRSQKITRVLGVVSSCDKACRATRAQKRRARLAAHVASMGVLKLLGTKGEPHTTGPDTDRASSGVGGLIVSGGRSGASYLHLPTRTAPGRTVAQLRQVFPSLPTRPGRSWSQKETIHGVAGTWRFRLAADKVHSVTWSSQRGSAEACTRYREVMTTVAREYKRDHGEPRERSGRRGRVLRWRTSTARFSVRYRTTGPRRRPRCTLAIELLQP